MLWNLVTQKYEKYNLHHCMLFIVLIMYSFFGAFVFCALEGGAEERINMQTAAEEVRRSVAAKKILVEKIHHLYFPGENATRLEETGIRKLLDVYDREMGLKPDINKDKRWSMWGALYYAGTIYTTIGYGDLAASTIGGRVFTMFYAIIGIPMVISILNDWGTLMFNGLEKMWVEYVLPYWERRKKEKEKLIDDEEQLCGGSVSDKSVSSDEPSPLPFTVVLVSLMLWMNLCIILFMFLEEWSWFESTYFFFISLTTIGFGDVVPSHKVAVANFLVILIGLSVVSMAINVLQLQLEVIFAKIVKSIDIDFKNSLSTQVDDSRRKSNNGEPIKMDTAAMHGEPQDAVEQFGKNMSGTERLMLRFMSNHQKKMLNEKLDERSKMRNKYTQTMSNIKVASVQTVEKHEEPMDYPEEEEEKPKSAIAPRRLYIYNIGSD